MNTRLAWTYAAALLLLTSATTCRAAELQLRTVAPDASPVAGMVVQLFPQSSKPAESKLPAAAGNWVMDQLDLQFDPEVLVIPLGAQVSFPNSDAVAHQVYSFSPTRRFSLGLYRGKRYPPVDFTKPGLVVLGCNIHDSMVGYIYVSETPYFGKSSDDGVVQFTGVPVGSYVVKVWSPRFKGEEPETLGNVTVVAGDNPALALTVRSPLRPVQPHIHHPKGLRY